jgi:mRNA-degrading endonuclease YafQ of YafQ-DinJ toxin-antitoxin module
LPAKKQTHKEQEKSFKEIPKAKKEIMTEIYKKDKKILENLVKRQKNKYKDKSANYEYSWIRSKKIKIDLTHS